MKEYAKTIETRLRFFRLLILLIVFALVWKMFDLEVIEHSHYLVLAQDQQRFEQTVQAERGKIYVHDSINDPNSYYPLAFDQKKFAVWAVPEEINDKNAVATALSPLLSIPKDDIYNAINNNKLYIPPLKHGLSLDESNQIKALSLTGVLIVPEYSRDYPEDTLASQVIGFVNAEGQGNYGVEGYYNDELKGKDGTLSGEKDTLGRIIDLLGQNPPENGASYVLTIDRSVQYFVEKQLAAALQTYQADSGSIVVMDVKTGGIVAMASNPTFDPNDFKDQAEKDPSIFTNPVISSLYEPGSVFKPIVMAAALDAGAVTPDTSSYFDKSVTVQGYTIHTAEDKAFGQETMGQILANSDNVGMVWVSDKLGKDAMYKYIKNFGFGEKTGIDLSGEASGQVPELKNWADITRATISFGQGISVTPIELAAAYATIANNGKYVYPHIVDKVLMPDGTEKQVAKQEGAQVVSTQTAAEVRSMLTQIIDTGHTVKAGVPGFEVGAKTGTAQIALPGGGYLDSDTKLGIYNHTVAGFAPAEDPEFAMIVKLDKPKTAQFAESTAAPVFGQIASFLLNYHYRATPTKPIN